MANWLEKILPPPQSKGRNLAVQSRPGSAPSSGQMPNASIIYGIAASVLFIVAIYFLFSRMWFTGLLVCLPASCFLGFCLHFMRHS
jgi:hypothetical protein